MTSEDKLLFTYWRVRRTMSTLSYRILKQHYYNFNAKGTLILIKERGIEIDKKHFFFSHNSDYHILSIRKQMTYAYVLRHSGFLLLGVDQFLEFRKTRVRMAGWETVAMHKMMVVQELPRRIEMQKVTSLRLLLQDTGAAYRETCYNILF
jgi:hypothetical protein